MIIESTLLAGSLLLGPRRYEEVTGEHTILFPETVVTGSLTGADSSCSPQRVLDIPTGHSISHHTAAETVYRATRTISAIAAILPTDETVERKLRALTEERIAGRRSRPLPR